jgi:hypothetical protein
VGISAFRQTKAFDVAGAMHTVGKAVGRLSGALLRCWNGNSWKRVPSVGFQF